MPLQIIKDDITNIKADAIVNAANTDLRMGGGVCGAIFRAAGAEKLQEACNKLAPIKTGEAVITDGFNSKAKYIIHTAGPIYSEGNSQQEKQLYDCYYNSLKLAAEKDLKSIAFPLISAGIYGYPLDKALCTAIKSINDFLSSYDKGITVYMTIFDDNTFAMAKKIYKTTNCSLM
ncbi:MAG: macro domain-containing protein [Bacteroidales bacterium]|nr:macro domain-containing protein [Bacteroidales bacterium]